MGKVKQHKPTPKSSKKHSDAKKRFKKNKASLIAEEVRKQVAILKEQYSNELANLEKMIGADSKSKDMLTKELLELAAANGKSARARAKTAAALLQKVNKRLETNEQTIKDVLANIGTVADERAAEAVEAMEIDLHEGRAGQSSDNDGEMSSGEEKDNESDEGSGSSESSDDDDGKSKKKKGGSASKEKSKKHKEVIVRTSGENHSFSHGFHARATCHGLKGSSGKWLKANMTKYGERYKQEQRGSTPPRGEKTSTRHCPTQHRMLDTAPTELVAQK